MRLRPRTGAVLGAAALLAVLATACTVGPSQRPPVAVRGDNMAAPAPADPPAPTGPRMLPEPRPGIATVDFTDCTAELRSVMRTPLPPDRGLRIDCGTLQVPLDPDPPTESTVQLQVVRVGKAGGAARPPLAVVGDSAVEPSALAAAVLAGQVPMELLDRFDLVAIDRRGSGYDNLDCAPVTARAALVDADPGAIDETSLGRLLDRSRALVQQCTIDTDGNLGQFRSSATSFDLEQLRDALGVRQLSAIGIGDGAAAVLGWIRTRPEAAGRIVLDGPPQPGLDDPDLTDTRTRATEAAFDAFAASCTARPGCPLGADPRAMVTTLMKNLQVRPLATRTGDRLTAGTALFALRTGLAEPRGWPELATALAAANAGDAAPLLAGMDRVLGPRGSFDGTLATTCNDTRNRLAPAQAAEFAGRMRDTYPLFGAAMALQVVECAAWPTGRPAAQSANAGLPPLLVLGTAADPRSTLDGARRLAQSLPGAVFTSWQGAGTGAFPRTECVSQVTTRMLVDGQLPADGTLCPP